MSDPYTLTGGFLESFFINLIEDPVSAGKPIPLLRIVASSGTIIYSTAIQIQRVQNGDVTVLEAIIDGVSQFSVEATAASAGGAAGLFAVKLLAAAGVAASAPAAAFIIAGVATTAVIFGTNEYITGDVLGDVTKTVSSSLKDLAKYAHILGSDSIEVNSTDSGGKVTYSVNHGDTVWGIAKQYDITVDELINIPGNEYLAERRFNENGEDYVLIRPGDKIAVPESPESEVSPTVETAAGDFGDAVERSLFCDPLIIDMDGDGLELDSWQVANTGFDLNEDGTAEDTGWTRAGGDDAFLVIDKNANGNIDDISEMFGNQDTAGFAELKLYDSNNDNKINANDSQFNLLKLWRDTNANGIVDSGEMTTLTQSGITQISLQKQNNYEVVNGNIRTAIADVTFSNGNTRTIHEVSFGFDNVTIGIENNPDQALGSEFALDVNAVLLPYSRGYGALYSWQAAMTLDNDLLLMAEEIAGLGPADFYKINEKFQSFLFRWADVENVTAEEVYDVGGAGIEFDPRKMAFLEKITGLDFIYTNIGSVPMSEGAWDLFFNHFLTKFLVQGTFADVFPNAAYDFATDTIQFGNTLDEIITNIESLAPSMDINNFAKSITPTKSGSLI